MRLAIAGGGTGGHLFPGLALAELAAKQGHAEDIVFFGAERGIESRLVPRRGYQLVAQPLTGVRASGVGGAIRGLINLLRSIGRARREILDRRIDVVVGLGGYASSAAVVGAWLARVPIVLLEQNREPGVSNRLLARLARSVCTSFEDTARFLPRGRARRTGNPVRPEIEAVGRSTRAERRTLLVFGGSGGAASLNRAVTTALVALSARIALPPVLHQTGAGGASAVRSAYEAAGIRADVREFIDDMATAYAHARVAVCRAGATTVAELVATGTPSVLVPFPHATGDHQTANARALESAGAARVVVDDDSAASELADVLARLLEDDERLDSMAERAAALRRPGAAEAVLEVVLEAARRPEAARR